MNIAIIPAGGVGARMGRKRPKQYLDLAGEPILLHTLRVFADCEDVDGIIVVVPEEYQAQTRELVRHYALPKVLQVVCGGRRRQDSVANGLGAVPAGTGLVLVHDGARPLVTPELIKRCLDGAQEFGAAMAALPVSDTLKRVDGDGVIESTIDRSSLYQAQTPQVMSASVLRQAFQQADADGFAGTDEASLLEHIGEKMVVVDGDEQNIKVTRPGDLHMAENILARRGATLTTEIRVGHGFDAHKLVEGRALVLGGVTIPHTLGLLGHSDADVLTHALCDGLLGAAGLGDIGVHFPDSDAAYRGISSIKLLAHVTSLLREKGYVLHNADITVVAETPKLSPYWSGMKAHLARACQVSGDCFNLKGTTTEKMGYTGRKEGISAHAVVLIQRG
jgi:2-C-methyl-D-erythritol 4-phosphate cytidylyltransferase/2-C-methyl-D-erythritol 2,4-cyclodiphosphate synthase